METCRKACRVSLLPARLYLQRLCSHGLVHGNFESEEHQKISHKNVVAVHDFNLEIADKEFIVLVGPSGCGKSTTLRMIAGLEDISDGDLFIGEKRMNDVEPRIATSQWCSRTTPFIPMTVYENMAFALKLRKTPKAEIDKKVREAAEILDTPPTWSASPGAVRPAPSVCHRPRHRA